jgi:hypothetical protein
MKAGLEAIPRKIEAKDLNTFSSICPIDGEVSGEEEVIALHSSTENLLNITSELMRLSGISEPSAAWEHYMENNNSSSEVTKELERLGFINPLLEYSDGINVFADKVLVDTQRISAMNGQKQAVLKPEEAELISVVLELYKFKEIIYFIRNKQANNRSGGTTYLDSFFTMSYAKSLELCYRFFIAANAVGISSGIIFFPDPEILSRIRCHNWVEIGKKLFVFNPATIRLPPAGTLPQKPGDMLGILKQLRESEEVPAVQAREYFAFFHYIRGCIFEEKRDLKNMEIEYIKALEIYPHNKIYEAAVFIMAMNILDKAGLPRNSALSNYADGDGSEEENEMIEDLLREHPSIKLLLDDYLTGRASE